MTLTSVVFYPGPWYVGGAESYVLNIARALGDHGDVAIVSSSRAGDEVLKSLRLPDGFDPTWRVVTTCNQAAVDRTAGGADIFVNCSPWDYPRPPRRSLSAVVAYYTPDLPRVGTSGRLARSVAARVVRDRPIWPSPRRALAAYDKILCVSQWTARLASQRWGRDAAVFYPAVRAIAPLAKERTILTVGRMAAGGTRKSHEDLIEAFRRAQLDGWRLVIAGAVNYAESMAMVDGWRRDLGGQDIEIVANPSREELEVLYGRASLYWHGAGFGATSGSVGREHFGISVVEAMSAGAVPLAFQGGGVREIVTDGKDGLLWAGLDDLVEVTRRLIGDEQERLRLSDQARVRAEHFSVEEHDRRVYDELIRPRS